MRLKRRAVGRAIVLLLVCDVVVVAVRTVEGSGDQGRAVERVPGAGGQDATGGTGPAPPGTPGGGPGATGPAGQPSVAYLAGTVAAIAADAASAGTLPVPLTLEGPRGVGRASIRSALMGGERVAIEWDAGQPLPLSGDGPGIRSGGVHVEADPTKVTVSLDGPTHRVLPGTYRAGSPVAVGTAGLARPADSARFVADERTTVTTRGGVTVRTGPRPLELTGPGKVSITGLLIVRTDAGLRSATTVVFGPGPFDLQLRPRQDGYELSGTLEGPLDIR